MTKKQLIEELAKYPDDMEILLADAEFLTLSKDLNLKYDEERTD